MDDARVEVLQRRQRGQHDDRRPGIAVAQVVDQIETVHARHRQIENDQVEDAGIELLHRLQPIAGDIGLHARAPGND